MKNADNCPHVKAFNPEADRTGRRLTFMNGSKDDGIHPSGRRFYIEWNFNNWNREICAFKDTRGKYQFTFNAREVLDNLKFVD